MKKGFAITPVDQPHHRVVFIPVRKTSKSTYELEQPYHIYAGCKLLDYGRVDMGGQTYCKLIMNIEGANEDGLPDMPKGWDYREEIKMRS